MKKTDIPAKFPIPFAANATGGFIRAIPETTADPTAASLDQGFPPNTFVPVGAGGSPPAGKDFNGILNEATSWDRWLSAGGPVSYDSAFQTAIGGYPIGTVVSSAVFLGNFWLSTADDNVTNPDAAGAGWVLIGPNGGGNQVFLASANFVVPAWITSLRRVRGAGGGGGAAVNQGGSGGSAGPFELLNYPVTPGASMPVVIGIAATYATSPVSAPNGTPTTFGPATSPGGIGSQTGGRGLGSTATGGTVNGTGTNGIDDNVGQDCPGGASCLLGFGRGMGVQGQTVTNGTDGALIIEWG